MGYKTFRGWLKDHDGEARQVGAYYKGKLVAWRYSIGNFKQADGFSFIRSFTINLAHYR